MLFLRLLKNKVLKLTSWLRRHSYIVVLFVAFIMLFVIMGLTGRTKTIYELWDLITRERQLHKERVAELDKINAQEVEAVDTIRRRTQEALRQAESEYVERSQQLERKQKTMIKKIVNDYKDDPEAAARKLAETFGFEFVL